MKKRVYSPQTVKSISVEVVTDDPDSLRDALLRLGWSKSREPGKIVFTGTASQLVESVKKAIKDSADRHDSARKTI
ncbi:MAG: hypothetical protein ACM3WU_04295 [Bacillota bacterium]